MKEQQSFKFHLCHHLAINVLFFTLCAAFCSAQTGILLDRGGAVFNVKAYGATGGGSTDDTPAIQSAINAATTSGGGVVYFPAGNYLLNGTLNDSRLDIVSLVGAGMGTVLTINSNLGISLASTAANIPGFHNGRIQGMFITCTVQSVQTAVQMTDMVAGPELDDLTISGCNQAFDIVNQQWWTERISVHNLTDNYNNHLFHYDQNPGNPNNSYGYGSYLGVYINKSAGQDVFYLTGGAYLYHSTFVIKGNFAPNATGASIFNVQGSSGQPCPGGGYDIVDIAVEGSSYLVVNASNNGCSGGAAGNSLIGAIGYVSAFGAAAGSYSLIADANQALILAANLTATSSSSDTAAVPTASPASVCHVLPSNAIAANAIVGTYVSGTNWGSVTVSHPSTAAGGLFRIRCVQ